MSKIDQQGNDLSTGTVFFVAEGFLTGWVCAPKSLTQEQVQAQVTWPSGTSAGWVVQAEESDDPQKQSPGKCDEDCDRQHWLVVC